MLVPLYQGSMSNLLQKKEDLVLASYAFKSSDSAGRKFPETFDDGRLAFQRDKDRIIHCKSFRRLDEKTQVFMAGTGDHYRTRLTHTLEVAQISRDIARKLCLNEDLCEAIALAHDLGHPPFGHAGENALNEAVREFGMQFEHNEQSRRVVETLEKAYPSFEGLNLTFEVLDGLIKHQTSFDQAGKEFAVSAHLEAQVVNIADEIAYTNHDMDDGLRSGLIKLDDLKKYEIWMKGEEDVVEKYGEISDMEVYISRVISAIISIMVEDLCKQTLNNLTGNHIKTPGDVQKYNGVLAEFSPNLKQLIKGLRKFLHDNFYLNPKIEQFTKKGELMIKQLFKYYNENPDKFPRKDKSPESIKDYIAGMTDNFLIKEHNKI